MGGKWICGQGYYLFLPSSNIFIQCIISYTYISFESLSFQAAVCRHAGKRALQSSSHQLLFWRRWDQMRCRGKTEYYSLAEDHHDGQQVQNLCHAVMSQVNSPPYTIFLFFILFSSEHNHCHF